MKLLAMPNTIFGAAAMLLVACGGGGDENANAGASSTYRAVVVPEGLTWEEAKQRAEADGGHLVTITSEEENTAVHALVADNPDIWVNLDVTVVVEGEENAIQVTLGPWIGFYQPPGSTEPAGGWTWVTDETASYDNWLNEVVVEAVEPNDFGGVEHVAHFFGQGLDNRADTWNDVPNDILADFAETSIEMRGDLARPRGYIVEIEP